jgi:superoxide reductase
VQRCAEKTSDWEDENKWISDSDIEIITNYLISTQLRKKKKVLSTLEMVHVPVFILPKVVFTREKFKVTAKVGQRNHPMVDKHYIHWLELYQDGVLLKKTEFKPGQEPKITALVQIGNVTELKAVTRCTMHGLWQAEKQIHAR